MKLILKLVFIALLILIGVAVIGTFLVTPPTTTNPEPVNIKINLDQVQNRLSQVIQLQTISYQDKSLFSGEPFSQLHRYLEATYPLVFSTLQKETVNQYSLLLKWQGKQAQLKPILFLAHQDVVPVAEESLHSWSHPPFAGVFDETFIWGRGALDDKASLTGILEAVNLLLEQGFQPQRTIYLAFGHDEEIGGQQGAAKIAQLLESRNIELEFVLDEGGLISDGILPGVEPLIGLIGVAEKGYLSLNLTVEDEGGHSSMPPKHTAIGVLSQAIVDLEANPFPIDSRHLFGLLERVTPYLPFEKRLIFANTWITQPLIEYQLSQSKTTNAMMRTTAAATIFNSGVKDNVLPSIATATINFRILPGETPASVKQRVKQIINNPLVKISGEGRKPSSISPVDSNSYKLIEKTIHQANAAESLLVVAPYLLMGGTDSRNFEKLTDNIYRFLFNITKAEDVKRYHSVDERISIKNYQKVIRFYYQLMLNSDSL